MGTPGGVYNIKLADAADVGTTRCSGLMMFQLGTGSHSSEYGLRSK